MHESIGELERLVRALFRLRMRNRVLSRRLREHGIRDNVTEEEMDSEFKSECDKYPSR